MIAPPPDLDPVDVAVSFPDPPPLVSENEVGDAPTRLAAPAAPGPVDVVLSAEEVTATKEWTQTGAVRFRRRIITYTRTVEVVVRREELEVQVRDVTDRDGAWVGTEFRGPAVPPPPVVTGPGVFVLREEVPDVTVRVVPYERVIVQIDRVTEQVQLVETARREQVTVSGDTGATLPPPRR